MGWESFEFVVARKNSARLAKPRTNAKICARRWCARLIVGLACDAKLQLSVSFSLRRLLAGCSSLSAPIGCSCLLCLVLSASRRTFPRRGHLFVVIDSSASRSRHPGVPSSSVLPCANHNTMIDLDDKENQSPLRLGFGKSPSPKRSRSKNTAPAAGQDVSDAPSKQSHPNLALVAHRPHSNR